MLCAPPIKNRGYNLFYDFENELKFFFYFSYHNMRAKIGNMCK